MADKIKGVLPSQSIKKLITDLNIISNQKEISSAQIQPASLDLRLGDTAYRVRASFLPGKKLRVEDRLNDFAMHKIDLRSGAVLEKGCVYIVPLIESLNLPLNITAASKAKSSTVDLNY